MTKINIFFIALAAATLTFLTSAQAAGNAAKGAQIFRRCVICHTSKAGEPNRVGPNLHGLFDREAGKAPAFNYSDGLKKANFEWDDEKLKKWLDNPQKFIPGARMAFRLANPQEREDVIAYLHEATK